MNIHSALKKACSQLESISDSARLDAELLLAYCLNQSRTYLYAYPEHELSDEQSNYFNWLIEERRKSLPIAYLIGEKEFWSLNFKISPQTLIPRPATESLVAFILDNYSNRPLSVCDLGTGSGAIAVSLAKHRPKWQITAVDIQAGALAIAKANAKRQNCHQIKFYCGHWFNKLPQHTFDIIISNPPYIDEQDEHLSQGDVQYEPYQALVSEQQGLKDLYHLIMESQTHLKPQGRLILEHGHQQQSLVLAAMQQQEMSDVQGHLDDEQNPRFCTGLKKP